MWIGLVLFAVLTWLSGAAWVHLLVPKRVAGRGSLVAGYGLLFGMLLTALLVRLVDLVFETLNPLPLGAFQSALIITALLLARFAGLPRGAPGEVLTETPPTTLRKLAMLALAVLIGLHLVPLVIEVIWRPLFPWDATSAWATKARVWFEYRSLVPFVDKETWLAGAGPGVFTDHMPDYPVVTPLLQLAANLFLGQWHDSLMNIPWLLCLLAAGLLFHGQARAAGAGPLPALLFVYFLLSMPLVNTHVALAGYADLFMGTVYAGAALAFYRWSVDREPWQGVLALGLVLCCPLIKNEGLFWCLSFLPGLLFVLMPRRRAVYLVAGLLVAGALLLWVFPRDLVVAGHSLADLDLRFRPEAFWPVIRSFAVFDSWHLLIYLLGGLGLLAVVLPGSKGQGTLLPLGATLATAVGLFLFLFLATEYAGGAVRYTAVSRTSMALVPTLLFFGLLLWLRMDRGFHRAGTQARRDREPAP